MLFRSIDVNEGGTAIPYWMEDPYIRREYEATLAHNGVANRMEPAWYDKPAGTSGGEVVASTPSPSGRR